MVIIDFKSSISKNFIKFSEEKTKSGFQDIYDIKGSFKDAHPTKLKIDGVKQIVIKQETPSTLRILFEDNKNLKTIYFFVNNKRLILKVLDVEKENKTTTNKIVKKAKKVQYRPGLNKVVVIDAGHGGKDVGAVGPNKRYEKIAVFEVTKYLESYLKKRGYKVYLTRNKDRFIKVRNRTILANEKKADIFVSIHANAIGKAKAHKLEGIETFFLSPARSERAKRVAAKENSSDVRNMSGSTKKAFLESLNRPRITASHKLSIDIQRNMLFSTRKIHKDVIDGGVREGPFWVLVGAQMPSVLIELGYITHPKESKRLYNSKYQKALAEGIANGIDSYFLKNP
ncbi:N-acetylmuramoyl-L-alanine amidase [Halarcobacter bivalviorum]|nr:N-acetylmuramoyl-L-alanine amidase [Halarcobacter bivalviorum]